MGGDEQETTITVGIRRSRYRVVMSHQQELHCKEAFEWGLSHDQTTTILGETTLSSSLYQKETPPSFLSGLSMQGILLGTSR